LLIGRRLLYAVRRAQLLSRAGGAGVTNFGGQFAPLALQQFDQQLALFCRKVDLVPCLSYVESAFFSLKPVPVSVRAAG
jgi:hypothetical protein